MNVNSESWKGKRAHRLEMFLTLGIILVFFLIVMWRKRCKKKTLAKQQLLELQNIGKEPKSAKTTTANHYPARDQSCLAISGDKLKGGSLKDPLLEFYLKVSWSMLYFEFT